MAYNKKLGYDDDPNFDYEALSRSMYRNGDVTGAYNALFGETNSRNAKIKDTGNDYGKSSLDIWGDITAGAKDDRADIDAIKSQLITLAARGSQTPKYGGSESDGQYKALLDQVANMSYDDWTQGDQYAALKDRYTQQGQQAMDDTVGMISARTGGLASSYAAAAGQQQYDNWMAMLNDAARAQYNNERSQLMENAGLYRDYGDMEYGRYLDQISQQRQDNSFLNDTLSSLLAFAYQDENTRYDRDQAAQTESYNRGQTAKTDAQNRLYDYFVNQGGTLANPSDDLASLIRDSGYTTAELNAMEAKYRENAAAAAAASARKSSGSSGSSSSGGGGASSSAGVYDRMNEAGIGTEADAYDWLLSNGYNTTQAGKFTSYYMSKLENGDFDRQTDLSDGGDDEDVTMGDIIEKLNENLRRGDTPAQIAAYIETAVNAGYLTVEQGAILKSEYER